MKFSKFGQKFVSNVGILQLMDDLGNALASGEKMLMLGGGNPSHIPQVQAHFRERMAKVLASNDEFERFIGNYGPPQGDKAFIEAMVSLLNQRYGWGLRPQNMALTNGSQTAFFCLFNLFAGVFEDGAAKKVLFPLAPEYIGYLDLGLTDDFFVANKPEFEYFDNRIFKYRVDFKAVSVTDAIGAICVSRPANPTGNVLTDEEVRHLGDLAQANDIPMIIDNAYGTPFPNIIFTEGEPIWNENIVLCMSLSKLGLPGARTGIIIANEQIVAAIAGMNAVTSLAPGNLGAVLAFDLVKSGQIITLSQEMIKPHYQHKATQAVNLFQKALAGLDFYIHKPEGAFFLWLWFKGLPITSQELYERLKRRRVIIVPGEYFFPGISEAWPHKYECVRVSYAQDEATVQAGIKIIAEEVKRAYDS
jgi:valine--pyruvate aminotransferase